MGQADLWSCGAILHLLLLGYPPFYAKNRKEIFDEIQKSSSYTCTPLSLIFPLLGSDPRWNAISEPARDLLRRLLSFNPCTRITVERALNHPWIVAAGYPKSEETLVRLNVLRRYLLLTGLQRAVLSYVRTHDPGEEGQGQVRQLFNFMDVDEDGEVTMQDLMRGYKRIYYNDCVRAKKEVAQIAQYLNCKVNFSIDYNGTFGA